MEKKQGKILLDENGARSKFLEGAKAVYDGVATTYGPKGKNVLIEKSFGRPLLTRDGVTVAKDIYFSDRLKNMGAQIIIEAAETTNRIAGDGTSATSVFSYNLLEQSNKAIAGGMHPMEVKETITQDSYKVLERLEELSVPVKDEQLEEVATVSVGDSLIGKLIAEALLYVGKEGGILTEKSPLSEVEREYIDGYYIQSGFTALQGGKKELEDPWVIVSSKRITTVNAVNQLIMKTYASQGIKSDQDLQSRGKIPTFAFIGEFDEAAYIHIANLINTGRIDAIVIKTPPQFGGMSKELLEDMAIYAKCKPITESTRTDAVDASYIGTVDKIVANKSEATMFADNETEAILARTKMLKEYIDSETMDATAEKLHDRLSKLEGKICIFKIGAPTETEKEELEFRIEDAINSTRNAYIEGIVPGGGATLLELSKLDVSPIYYTALRNTFKRLLGNAGFETEVKLREALDYEKPGYGYNLRKSDELVDVMKEGIIDPLTVVREVIKNSTSAIGGAVTIGSTIIYEDKE